VIDSKLVDKPETRGSIKLVFKAFNGKNIIAVKSF
jgi:hypothetical protein